MNISYINDLHIDFWVKWNQSQQKYKARIQAFIELLIAKSDLNYKEVLIIAGDISHFNFVTKWVLEVFSKHFEKVFVVSGNHDYYLLSKNQKSKYDGSSMNRIKELKDMIDTLSNVTYFHSKYSIRYEVYKGITFAGITMTSLPETDKEKHFYRNVMNDSKYITESPDSLNRIDLIEYKVIIGNIKPDVFISHYPLIMTGSQKRYLNDGSIGSYLCRVGEHAAPINFFGHVHENNMKYKVGENIHFTNALGYPNEGLRTKIKQIEI